MISTKLLHSRLWSRLPTEYSRTTTLGFHSPAVPIESQDGSTARGSRARPILTLNWLPIMLACIGVGLGRWALPTFAATDNGVPPSPLLPDMGLG